MACDKGGRRYDIIALDQHVDSPMNTVTASAGAQAFSEPLPRHSAESHSTEDKRQERKELGYVHFKPVPHVPDVGGIGWRTRAGHMLKNQAYYSSKPATNMWDDPVRAGINSWKDWHGPRLRTDAPMMERMDHYDEEADEHEAKKTFVNTTRAQTLDRFYNKKLNRDQLEASQSWAPHRRARREVSDCHEHFFGDLDSKPEKELKKVLTKMVLQRDRDAIRAISTRVQNEETWKVAWKHMEQERRQDIRHDFRHRQSYNDLLMQLSGQPVRQRDWESQDLRLNNCSQRTESLSVARDVPVPTDVTSLTDYRGLFHCDNAHALEALFPGSGHELSVEFRQGATASVKPGYPAPPKATTPRKTGYGSRDKAMQQSSTLTQERVPISKDRLDCVAARTNCEVLKSYSKAQFLPTSAPPPPNQRQQLLREDFSPQSTLNDPFRVTGSFQRTEQGSLSHGPFQKKTRPATMESLPPAQRSYTYPMLAPTSPTAKGAQDSRQASEMGSPNSTFYPSASQCGQGSASAPMLMRNNSSSGGFTKKRRNSGAGGAQSSAVCQELDQFESSMASLPRVCNFFGTPRSHRRLAQSTSQTQLSGGMAQLSRSISAPTVQQTT